ncbi:hypothetical protein QWY75_13785 [Pontixanthobacter aestiaquae]|uniref:DUF7668 domain-containing protein n=1 Tax=Pontixanthobacter aestiaquae TaxID=1509367 RepID=A0A844ZBM0_9SPHN|nr:hypothetical protein [Pontixanthobacter aestiaquae]MDN3647277.1 hypothetical protein [Pontixanthobacter aestiaquae]MXO84417.1 hypothetical protein [Pontixanthobacter aestiaquae]
MPSILKVEKDGSSELPIPLVWRSDLAKIVEYLISKDSSVIDSLDFAPISKKNFAYIDQTIDLYGCTLVSLPDESWHTSFYRWMNGFWELWIDLFSLEEGASDLVLVVKVFESDDSYRFEFQSLHVP